MTALGTQASCLQVKRVSGMFARIAHRYDLMNRLMSAGRDQAWRTEAALLAAPTPGARALDVATGTADLAIALRERDCEVVGLDPCDAMLRLGKEKSRRDVMLSEAKHLEEGKRGSVTFLLGDAHSLPFQGEAFDCVTVAFGIRNMEDPVAAFREMHRVLRPGGRIVCLEIMPPAQGLAGRCYQLYLNKFIPWLGGRVSGQPDAYEYLSGSVMAFKGPMGLKALIEQSAFAQVHYHLLHLGSIAIHLGVKRL